MLNAKKALFVEGEGDKSFFDDFIKLIKPGSSVKSFPPNVVENGNGVDNLFKGLNIAIKQMHAGQIDNFGIIIDADYTKDGNGFLERRKKICAILAHEGYVISDAPNKSYCGELFEHSDGLPSIGLWIMPNHLGEGMLEDFLLSSLKNEDQLKILTSATKFVTDVEPKLFNIVNHLSKARLACHLGVQRRPGIPPGGLLAEGVFDVDGVEFKKFISWFNSTFP